MNRDYGANQALEPVRTFVDPATPTVIDYLMPLCALCFVLGSEPPVSVEIGGLYTYAHPVCVDRWNNEPEVLI